MSDRQPGHGGPDHAHGHVHAGRPGVTGRLRHVLRPHSHDVTGTVDAALPASTDGIRALWISLAVLSGTALLQAAVAAVSGSVALLGDTLHNAADALTAVPLGIAFVAGRRPPTRRYTYGYGRAEDLAGIVIVVVIAASSALAASLVQAHQAAVSAEHNLVHALPRLAAALVHADPQPRQGADHHAVLASHR